MAVFQPEDVIEDEEEGESDDLDVGSAAPSSSSIIPPNPTIKDMMLDMQIAHAALAVVMKPSFLEEVAVFAAQKYAELNPTEAPLAAKAFEKVLAEGVAVAHVQHRGLMVPEIGVLRKEHEEANEKRAKRKQRLNGLGEPLSTPKILNSEDRMEELAEFTIDQHGKQHEKEQGKVAKRAAIESEKPLVQAFCEAGESSEGPFSDHWMKTKMTKLQLEKLATVKKFLDGAGKTTDTKKKLSGFFRPEQVTYLLEKLKPA